MKATIVFSQPSLTVNETADNSVVLTAIIAFASVLQGPPGPRGADGADGKSSYELWLEAGNTGTLADFLASLVGPQGPTGANGSSGANGTNGTDGSDGKSAYELWLEAGNTGTLSNFLASLVGPQGPAGANGSNGANGTNGTDGSDGKSAYELWLEAGNTGTEADFLASLIGPQGPAGSGGLSDYDFTELTAPTITSGATTITFVANQRNGVELSTNADLAIALISNNKSDNYIWITNSHSTADIDVIFSSIKFGSTTINDVIGTDSIPAIAHGETLEIGIYVTDSKARITSRIL